MYTYRCVRNNFSSDILSRIKLIISDGDQQECGSIDNGIGMFMKVPKRGRCGWHIVNRNFSTIFWQGVTFL